MTALAVRTQFSAGTTAPPGDVVDAEILRMGEEEASMAVQAFERQVTVPAWVPAEPEEASREERPRRRHLRVVRDGEVAVRPRLRLTRRGRLVRTLAVFGALCLLSLVAAARWASPDLPPTHSVTVRPGQTLLEIATEELPMVPTEAAALRIRLTNGLNSSVVMAGQSLVIPGES